MVKVDTPLGPAEVKVPMSLDELRGRATCSVEEAGELFGISRRSAYRAANTGELPTIRVGRRLLVAVPALLAMLGETPDGPRERVSA